MRQVIVLSVYGLLLALLFLAFQAPDVTLSELTVGAVVLPLLLLLGLAKVRSREKEHREMTPRLRRWVFLAGMAGLAAFYLWGLHGLPGFGRYPGPYGDVINRIAVGQTNATGVVSAVNFEYRGFDTLGEEFILFAAATGVAVVLRRLRGEQERSAPDEAAGRDVPPTSEAIRQVALILDRAHAGRWAGTWPRTRRPARPGGFRAEWCWPPPSY